ncbi:MAG: hypothetical protein R3Y35_09130 [Clostridia bacterium]
MDKKLKNALKQNFDAGTPQRKEEFLSKLNFPKLSFAEVFLNQIHYISKIFWICSVAVLAFVCYISTIADPKEIELLSSFIPLIAVISIIELHKSSSYNMEELEQTFKHNLAQTTVMKLAIVGVVSLFVLSVAMIFTQINVLSILVPYLAVSFISLFITNIVKGVAGVYACIGGTSLIITANYYVVFNEFVIAKSVYLIIALVLGLLVFSQIFVLIYTSKINVGATIGRP